MSVDFHQLLTGLLEISQTANFSKDDMSADLGERLVQIQDIADALLIAAGWNPNVSDDQDELDGDE